MWCAPPTPPAQRLAELRLVAPHIPEKEEREPVVAIALAVVGAALLLALGGVVLARGAVIERPALGWAVIVAAVGVWAW